MRSGWQVLMTVLRRPSLSGHESRCSAKSLVSVCSSSSGTLTGSIQLFFDVVSSVSSSFGYFSLSPCVPKLCLLASNDPLEKNVNYLHAIFPSPGQGGSVDQWWHQGCGSNGQRSNSGFTVQLLCDLGQVSKALCP